MPFASLARLVRSHEESVRRLEAARLPASYQRNPASEGKDHNWLGRRGVVQSGETDSIFGFGKTTAEVAR